MEGMKYAKGAAVVRWSGGTTVLRMNQSIDPDHPLVAERPELFRDDDPGAEIKTPGAPVVERATRAPGEVRTTPGTGPRAGRVPRGGSGQ